MSDEEKRQLLVKLLAKKAQENKVFPMSEGQQGLWHAFRRDPNQTSFNVFLPTRVRSGLNLDALQKSIELIARRNPLLTATFSDAGGELLQTIHESRAPEFSVIDILGADDGKIQQVVGAETLKAFDLESGPLLRMLLYRVGEDDYVLLALTHHIVMDFWSLVIILDEVRCAYAGFTANAEPKLDAAVKNFAEFVKEQREHLESSEGKRLQAYWQHVLGQGSPVLNLPLDRVRPTRFTSRAANCALPLTPELGRQLQAVAKRNSSTPFSVLNAAVQVFLSRYGGELEFFIGSPFSGRNSRKFEKTVGFFVNMLPIHADLSDAPTFDALVRRTGKTLFNALAHENYPIARMVQDAKIVRDRSRSPAFQVSCTFEKAQLKEESGRAGFLFPGEKQVWDFAGMQQESFYIPVQTCHYDLEFIFEQTDETLQGMFCYCRDLFSKESVEQFAENFVSLLQSLLDRPSESIRDVRWGNAPAVAKGREDKPSALQNRIGRVEHLIGNVVERQADSTAISFQNATWTYGEFASLAREIAKHAGLTESSQPRDHLIPIYARRTTAVWAAMFALHQAGYAFVPIDAGQPGVDLREVMEQTKASFALIAPEYEAEFAADGFSTRPLLDAGLSDLPTETRTTASPVSSRGDELAYAIFTSGSTGKPKGVMVDQQAVCNTLHWRMTDVPLEPTDRVLMLLSHQFDAGLGIAWTTLTQGATLVLADEETLQDPQTIIELIIRERINVIPAPPSLLSLIVSHPKFRDCAANLKYLWTGGEAMSPGFPELVRSRCNARLFNFYGPTEAAIEATFCDVTDHDKQIPVPLGHTIDNAEIVIVDEQQHLLPSTVPGEIAIGGAGLARGYLGDAKLTESRFIPHPADATKRLYLTGDRGRINTSGQVEFFGRTDHQVKLRGYRIELGEIEAAIESHLGVDRAAVKIVDAGSPNAKLVAFASPLSEKSTSEKDQLRTELRSYLSDRLPSYKIPAALMMLDALPETSSGKVNRKRLPQIDPNAFNGIQVIVPASNALEEFLLQDWLEVLGLEEASVNQNFFDVGGSSLQAALLTSRWSEGLEIDIPTSLLFDLTDLTQIAARIAVLHPESVESRFGQECIQQISAGRGKSDDHKHPLVASFSSSGESIALGAQQPIFMIHPPGGIVVCYRELAKLLGSRPLFAIRSHGLHGDEELPASVEAMAAAYREAIRSVQPSGPYLLGGWSLGGLVAYEVAQQALAVGEAVSRLVLLDTTIPENASYLVPAKDQVNVGLEYGIELSLDQLGELTPEEQLPFLWEHAKKLGVIDEKSPPEVIEKSLRELQGLFHHHVSVSRDYRMRPIEADILLFRPQEVPFELQVSEDRGWGALAKTVDVKFVPGHHHSMVQSPNIEVLARELDEFLS